MSAASTNKSSVFEGMLQHEAEKGKIETRPAIPFIPLPSHLNYSNTIEFKLRISKTDSKNTYMKKIPILSSATPEDIILWLKELEIILLNKPCKSPSRSLTGSSL